MKNDEIYAIEDTQTSCWPSLEGTSKDLDNPKTSMKFLKKLPDSLNHQEFLLLNYNPSYFDNNIVAIHSYYNMVVINKEHNDMPLYSLL